MDFTITIETNTTSESLTTHELLFDAKYWASIYQSTKRVHYMFHDYAAIVIWQGEHLIEHLPFDFTGL